MNYLLIPDKFKGSATAKEVVDALKKGIQQIDKKPVFKEVIASDGGDGFLSSVQQFEKVISIDIPSKNAYLDPIDSNYLWNNESKTAYIELANTVGIANLKNHKIDINKSSTYGTGIQLKHALDKGAEHIYLGVGGSATNDAAMGLLYGIGFKFIDINNQLIIPTSGNLNRIKTIIPKPLPKVNFYVINDVDNPLYGPQGAAAVYAPQKGASKEEVRQLDESLIQLSKLIKSTFEIDVASIPGTGAAGGTAYGLKAFLNAQFIPGFEFLKERAKLDELLKTTTIDYIITGEGHFDEQSLYGKLIEGILKLGQLNKIPCLIICGASSVDPKYLKNYPIESIIQLKRENRSLKDCINNSQFFIEKDIAHYLKSTL